MPGGKLPGAGRKPYQPTDAQRLLVQVLSASGMPHESLRQAIINPTTSQPITLVTLYKKFRAELDGGMNVANAMVAKTLFERACAGDVGCIVWWEKTRGRKKEIIAHEIGGPDGAPISVAAVDATKAQETYLKMIQGG